MSPEQKKRLEQARANLYDVLIEEVEDPAPSMKTKEGRGDRYWKKKNAIASANLIMRLEDLLGLRGVGASWRGRKDDEKPDDQPAAGEAESAGKSGDPEKLIAEAEAKVAARLKGKGAERGKGPVH